MKTFQKTWILCLAITAFAMMQGCKYPNNTKQAKAWRKEMKAKRAEEKARVAALPLPIDTLSAAQKDSLANLKNRKGGRRVDVAKAPADSVVMVKADSAALPSPLPDSAVAKVDSNARKPVFAGVDTIRFSKDSLAAPVSYEALDSMLYELIENKIYLWGNAHIAYQDLDIRAARVVVDFKNHLAYAEGELDSLTGKRIGNPVFRDGEQNFTARKIEYNFITKKGKVYDGVTEEGEGFLHSADAKYISKESGEYKDDVIFAKSSLYTTCDAEHPHFGVRATKAKIIPNKLIVVGASYVEIAGVPTPLFLPFGFFPLTKNRRSGIVFPTDFDNSPSLGIGFKNFGYYFGFSDYMDLELTGDVYTRGSLAVRASSNYKKRYKFSGNLRIGYSFLKFGDPGTPEYDPNHDFNINWTHRQEQGAHPSNTFSASLNFGTGTYRSNNFNDAASVLTSTFNSNISFTKTFPGKPFTLAMSLVHSQDNTTHNVNISFPNLDFRMNTVYPFRKKKRVGKPKWWEEIGFRYSVSAQNQLQTKDSILFSPRILDTLVQSMRYGIKHDPQLQLSLKVFKFFNITPSISYGEKWYFYRNHREFDPTLIIDNDTTFANDGSILSISSDTTFGKVNKVREDGFFPVREFSAGINVSTQLYGTLNFKKGYIRALRHTLRPTVGVQWRPDFSEDRWHYYDSVQTDARYPNQYDRYGLYTENIFGAPGSGKSALLTYSLSNVFEAKVHAPRDSTAKGGVRKVSLLSSLNISGNYNFIADSLQLSPINISGNTTLFKIVGVNFRTTLDPYTSDPLTNRRLNTFEWTANRRLLRFTQASLNLSTGFDGATLAGWFGKKKSTSTKPVSEFAIIQRTNLTYTLTLNRRYENGRDTINIVQNLGVNGGINISQHWHITYNFSYDFVRKRIAYPDFNFTRDLHCWELGLNWAPERQYWGFYLRVKGGPLNFLNIPARKNFYDPF